MEERNEMQKKLVNEFLLTSFKLLTVYYLDTLSYFLTKTDNV